MSMLLKPWLVIAVQTIKMAKLMELVAIFFHEPAPVRTAYSSLAEGRPVLAAHHGVRLSFE